MSAGLHLSVNVVALFKGRGIAAVREDMKAMGYHIGQGTLQRIIAGDTGVRLSSIEKLADYFGLSVIDLLTEPETLQLVQGNHDGY